MALNAATDQQYHLLDQDGTADDQMDQLQGDYDTRKKNAYKSADDKHSSRSHSRSPGRKPRSPSKKSAPAPTQQNLHRGPPGGGAKGNGGGSRMQPTGIITS
ncbi:hypothetical protein MRX96_050372, partial [Rhipicephalus microplus]